MILEFTSGDVAQLQRFRGGVPVGLMWAVTPSSEPEPEPPEAVTPGGIFRRRDTSRLIRRSDTGRVFRGPRL